MQYGHLWLAGMVCYGLACVLIGIDSAEDIWASEKDITAAAQTAPSAQSQQNYTKQPVCILGQAFLTSASLDEYASTYYISDLLSRESSPPIVSDINDQKTVLDTSSTFSTPSTKITYSDTLTDWNSYSLATNISEPGSKLTEKTMESKDLSPVACELHIPQLAENAETSLAGDFPGAKVEEHVIANFTTSNSRYMITSSFVLHDGKVAINIKNLSGRDLESEVLPLALAVFSG